MPASRRASPRRKPVKSTTDPSCFARSRVGNGRDYFIGDIDERSLLARRFREIHSQIITDIAGDPTEAQTQIARRAASLCVWCESAEAEMAKGNEIDIGQFTTAANSLRRLLADLGIERKSRDLTPSLDQYLRTRERHAEAIE